MTTTPSPLISPTTSSSPKPLRPRQGVEALAKSLASPNQPPHRAIQNDAVGTRAIWSLEYYTKFFDVDTQQVVDRCIKSLYPIDNFSEVLGGNPDLYGPFWISKTVIFVLFVTSSMAGSLAAKMGGKTYSYDYGLLSYAVFVIYLYGFGTPLLVWAATKYYGCQPSLLEVIDIYGYGLTVWIPVSILCVIPSDIVRWVFVTGGSGVSVYFLIKNMLAILSRADAKTSRFILIALGVAHAVLSLLLKVKFYSYSIKEETGKGDGQ
ncbi:hypothetical protein BC938DRAFT_476996 [Jimgerdemannia flammicorona]|uniref:Protein YIP n=1 Tax=Jimgerdemannia flammicorona TaxID=994334 RepID=A0A433PCS6_9FUNG|nr:hypothetical protein BC938DRAFT_476996 [Jimgerdemannia flammicorona]